MYIQYSYRKMRSKSNVIRVFGEGKVEVHPNKADIRLGVSTSNRILAQALEENARAISTIKAALIRMGILEKEIKTIDYSIYPQYDFVDGQQVFRSYKVNHLLLIQVLDLDKAGAVVDTAVNQGANLVQGITFGITDYDPYYHQALSLAVVDAGRKAETIANTLKVQLAKAPLSIIENRHELAVPYQAQSFVKGAATTTLQPGIMDVVSSVTVEYAFFSM